MRRTNGANWRCGAKYEVRRNPQWPEQLEIWPRLVTYCVTLSTNCKNLRPTRPLSPQKPETHYDSSNGTLFTLLPILEKLM